jgi:hypothetical protein
MEFYVDCTIKDIPALDKFIELMIPRRDTVTEWLNGYSEPKSNLLSGTWPRETPLRFIVHHFEDWDYDLPPFSDFSISMLQLSMDVIHNPQAYPELLV